MYLTENMLSKWKSVRKINKWKNSKKRTDDHSDDTVDNKHTQVRKMYFK